MLFVIMHLSIYLSIYRSISNQYACLLVSLFVIDLLLLEDVECVHPCQHDDHTVS